MKKLIVLASALACGISLYAQDSSMNNNNNMQNNPNTQNNTNMQSDPNTQSNPNTQNSTEMQSNPSMQNNTNMQSNPTQSNSDMQNNSSTQNNPGTQSDALMNNGTVPANIQTSFQSTYPSAANVKWETVTLPVFSQYWRTDLGPVQWYPAMQGYRATYVVNNRIMHVYYTDRVKTYVFAGPVIESWVPEDVITKVINQYSGAYDITVMKNTAKEDIYQVRYSENGAGSLSTAYIKADGSAATSTDVFVLK